MIHLIRHAHAGSRHAWEGPDDERPLSERGVAQARTIADELAEAGIDLLWSSPSLRCRQTLEPLADRLGLPIAVSDPFDEGGSGPAALDAVLDAAADGRTIAVCSHGDVLPAVVATAMRRGAEVVGPRAMAKGARYECTVVDGQLDRLVHIESPDKR